jgi:hypothetical protein
VLHRCSAQCRRVMPSFQTARFAMEFAARISRRTSRHSLKLRETTTMHEIRGWCIRGRYISARTPSGTSGPKRSRHSWTARTQGVSNSDQSQMLESQTAAFPGARCRRVRTSAHAYLLGRSRQPPGGAPREHPSASDKARQWFPGAPLAATTSSEEPG